MVGMTKSRGLRIRRGTRATWVAENQGKHFCGCGCDEPIRLRDEHFSEGIPGYLLGHNSRVSNPAAKSPLPQNPCGCGCGELTGPGKRFVYAHSQRGQRRSEETRAKLRDQKLGERNPMYGKRAWNAKDPLPAVPCACGCNEDAAPGRLYISGHNIRGETGAAARAYKAGRFRRVDGYVAVLASEHPHARADGYVWEHRLVVERHLREVDPGSPYLYRLGEQLYLRPEYVVHHRNEVKDDNRIEDLMPLTPEEHLRLHWEERRTR